MKRKFQDCIEVALVVLFLLFIFGCAAVGGYYKYKQVMFFISH